MPVDDEHFTWALVGDGLIVITINKQQTVREFYRREFCFGWGAVLLILGVISAFSGGLWGWILSVAVLVLPPAVWRWSQRQVSFLPRSWLVYDSSHCLALHCDFHHGNHITNNGIACTLRQLRWLAAPAIPNGISRRISCSSIRQLTNRSAALIVHFKEFAPSILTSPAFTCSLPRSLAAGILRP